jgi:transcriptional regulator GlxA family with amidase domain
MQGHIKLCEWVNKNKVKVITIAHQGGFASSYDFILFYEKRLSRKPNQRRK